MFNNEQVIIKKCQQGELTEFSRLYDHYLRPIYDFIYYKTYHQETAEDLTSQTFIKALEKINTYKAGKGTFKSWLYKIAQNTVIDYWRARKSEANIEDIWDLSADDPIEVDLEVKENLNRIKKYLQQLKPRQRNVLIMRLWQELSYKEIADNLDLSEANCKMIYSRAMKNLRQAMPLSVWIIFLLMKI